MYNNAKGISGFFLVAIAFFAMQANAQLLDRMVVDKALKVKAFQSDSGSLQKVDWPLVSFEMDGQLQYSDSGNRGMAIAVQDSGNFKPGIRIHLLFTNTSADTVVLRNVVPFGENPDGVYITGKGNHGLSRTHVFVPGYAPVNCIVPDNAWELGFAARRATGSLQVCALVRRDRASISKGRASRFETTLYPGGSVRYVFYANSYRGNWQEGLRYIFQEKMLFDVEDFDNGLFERSDLQWIRRSYVMHLKMAWDRDYYDAASGRFNLEEFILRGKKRYGGDDAIGLWPTWPTLGLDERNQFDLFRDLPGGLPALNQQVAMLHRLGSRLLLAYNPWDESTRAENQMQGLADILAATGADGAILDTRGSSSRELQQAADGVKPGIVMYSEGMAVPRDMQGIVSGRVHNALYHPPLLNLNKFIKPDFAIFRVAELYKEPIQREFATSFFNGYGTELNVFGPGNPDWADEQYLFLGRTSRLLRENTENFTAAGFTPLVHSQKDSVYVNKWPLGEKTIYTIFSLLPEGYAGPLVEMEPQNGKHYINLWHHEEIVPQQIGDKFYLPAKTDGFSARYSGTNNEGMVDCLAEFPVLLQVEIQGEQIQVSANAGDSIHLWAGNPDYAKAPLVFQGRNAEATVHEVLNFTEGKIVIQLKGRQGQLLDERVLTIVPGKPRLVSSFAQSRKATGKEPGMARIPAGSFVMKTTHGDDFIPYPDAPDGDTLTFPAFMMDKHPVTNLEFLRFMQATRYIPKDTANFLKHWINGNIPAGLERFPVVYVSLEDAQAYASWAGKRLPSEAEWQYAAQAADGRSWPWSQDAPAITREEERVTATLTVFRIKGLDSSLVNLTGQLYAIGKYPAGSNPYGLQDLSGSVWQLTQDVYQSGNYQYIMLKGGSYFNPSSSWWYVQGGPRELHYRQYLLRVSPGFERNATVGFRCVKDF